MVSKNKRSVKKNRFIENMKIIFGLFFIPNECYSLMKIKDLHSHTQSQSDLYRFNWYNDYFVKNC